MSWKDDINFQKRKLIEDLADHLANEYPHLFGKDRTKALVGNDYELARGIARRAVLSRGDILSDDVPVIVDEIMGQASQYGPLQELFVGPVAKEITEVMVNPSPDGRPKVYYGEHGRLYYAGDHYFKSNEEVANYARMICQACHREFTEVTPIQDAWLRDGSRVSVFGYRVCPLGTAINIRKSPLIRPVMSLDTLVANGMMPVIVAGMIRDLIVRGRANWGAFGRMDSGKTTVLRAAGEYFDRDERIMIAETSFELAFPNMPNCLNLVEVGFGDKKIVSLHDICTIVLLRNNPNRMILGEMRGGEAVDAAEMAEMTADGFVTSGHAGGLNELRGRLPKMFARGGFGLNQEYVDIQIATMFHFLLFFDKAYDGTRLLMSLVEVTGDSVDPYRTIIQFDEDEFVATKKKRWIYVNPISPRRISRLAFKGGVIEPEYTTIKEKYLY